MSELEQVMADALEKIAYKCVTQEQCEQVARSVLAQAYEEQFPEHQLPLWAKE
jgi:hypothetical protein